MQVVRLLLHQAVVMALLYAVQRWDKSRLPAEKRERAWTPATWGAALFWFGPLSMIAWGWVTRRETGLVGTVRGACAMVLGACVGLLCALAAAGVDMAFAWALGLPLDLGEELFGG